MPITTSKNSFLYSRFLIGKVRQFFVTASLTELAEHTERNINTLSVQITKLENDGLVVKIRDTPKLTKVRFKLTEKGLIICKSIKHI